MSVFLPSYRLAARCTRAASGTYEVLRDSVVRSSGGLVATAGRFYEHVSSRERARRFCAEMESQDLCLQLLALQGQLDAVLRHDGRSSVPVQVRRPAVYPLYTPESDGSGDDFPSPRTPRGGFARQDTGDTEFQRYLRAADFAA